jgi:hypothetical protein
MHLRNLPPVAKRLCISVTRLDFSLLCETLTLSTIEKQLAYLVGCVGGAKCALPTWRVLALAALTFEHNAEDGNTL